MDMKDYDLREQDHFKLKVRDKVRIVNDNLSKEHYVNDSIDGNGYIINSMDESVAYYPRHKQVKDSSDSFAAILDNGKRAIINDIIGYNERSQKYKVIYTDNSVDYIKAKSLRETNPTSLWLLEREYWKVHTYCIPGAFRAYGWSRRPSVYT